MHCTFKNVKQKAEQEDSFTWVATWTANKTHQWCHSDHQHDYQTYDVIVGRSRNRFSFSQRKRSNNVTDHIVHTLEEMGHPQPPTPLQTDNTTATQQQQDTAMTQ
jgi:hypothetical protein